MHALALENFHVLPGMLEGAGIDSDVEETLTQKKSRYGIESEVLEIRGNTVSSLAQLFGANRFAHAPEILAQIG
jgi:hypothetical protein